MAIRQTTAPETGDDVGSLKGFHVVFLVCAGLLAVVLGIWGTVDYQQNGAGMSLAIAIFALAAAVVLLIYGRWFVRKMRGVAR